MVSFTGTYPENILVIEGIPDIYPWGKKKSKNIMQITPYTGNNVEVFTVGVGILEEGSRDMLRPRKKHCPQAAHRNRHTGN